MSVDLPDDLEEDAAAARRPAAPDLRVSARKLLAGLRTPDALIQRPARLARWPLLLLGPIGWTVLRWAWISDDSLIAARVVLNFVHGDGPVYNVGERVQAFTHPLGFFIWSTVTWVTGEAILVPALMAVVFSVGAAFCVWRGACSATSAFIALFGLLVSGTFAVWATSGLESPLAMLLIGILWCTYRNDDQRLVLAGLLVALIALTRLDLLVLVAPVAVVMVAQARGRAERLKFLAAAALPVLAYLAWSWVYYGYPLPATFYAKTNVAIPRGELMLQGFRYVTFWARAEPESALLLAAGLVLLFRARSSYATAWGAGVIAYLMYVMWVGRDFMEGRFLVVPLFVSALGVARYFPSWSKAEVLHPLVLAAGCCVLLWALAGSQNPVTASDSATERWSINPADGSVNSGIADERGYWVTRGFGLSEWFYSQAESGPDGAELDPTVTRRSEIPRSKSLASAERKWPGSSPSLFGRREIIVRCGLVGYYGIRAGPNVHMIDPCGLADMYLAQIRFEPPPGPHWRIGHFHRPIPDGYEESVITGTNQVRDPELHRLLDDVWKRVR